MVSIRNDDMLKFYFNNDTYNQYSNLLSYPTNLSFIDYKSCMLAQDYYSAQKKKRKKLREQIAIEKFPKEDYNTKDPNKNELIEWLKSLSIEQLHNVFSIENTWLVIVVLKMYQKYQTQKDITFALQFEDTKKIKDERNAFDFGELDNHFYCRKQQSNQSNEYFEKKKAEEEIIQNIRICDHNEFYDTIVLNEKFLTNINRVLEIFDLLSDQQVFSKPYKQANQPKSNIPFQTVWWFNPNSFQTLTNWIISSLEKSIWLKYFEIKKKSAKNDNILIDQLESKITLSYKHNLISYWSQLEKTRKKKLVNRIPEIIQNLENVSKNRLKNKNVNHQQIQQETHSLKDNLQKLAYLYSIYKDSGGLLYPQNKIDSIMAFYNSMIDEKDDEKMIDYILFTTLDQFGTLTNIVGRRLATKLKNTYSEKVASELILNEEKEKLIKKNQTKIKKLHKKKSIPNEFNALPTKELENDSTQNTKSCSQDNQGSDSNSENLIAIDNNKLTKQKSIDLEIIEVEMQELTSIPNFTNKNYDKCYNGEDYCADIDCEIKVYCKFLTDNMMENTINSIKEESSKDNNNIAINQFDVISTKPEIKNKELKINEIDEKPNNFIKKDDISIKNTSYKAQEDESVLEGSTSINSETSKKSKEPKKANQQQETEILQKDNISDNILDLKDISTEVDNQIIPKQNIDSNSNIKDEKSESNLAINKSEDMKSVTENTNIPGLIIDELAIFDEFDKKISRSKKRRLKRKMKMKNSKQLDQTSLTPKGQTEFIDMAINTPSPAKSSQTTTYQSKSANDESNLSKNDSTESKDTNNNNNNNNVSDEEMNITDKIIDTEEVKSEIKVNYDENEKNNKNPKSMEFSDENNDNTQKKDKINTAILTSITKTSMIELSSQDEFIEVKPKHKLKVDNQSTQKLSEFKKENSTVLIENKVMDKIPDIVTINHENKERNSSVKILGSSDSMTNYKVNSSKVINYNDKSKDQKYQNKNDSYNDKRNNYNKTSNNNNNNNSKTKIVYSYKNFPNKSFQNEKNAYNMETITLNLNNNKNNHIANKITTKSSASSLSQTITNQSIDLKPNVKFSTKSSHCNTKQKEFKLVKKKACMNSCSSKEVIQVNRNQIYKNHIIYSKSVKLIQQNSSSCSSVVKLNKENNTDEFEGFRSVSTTTEAIEISDHSSKLTSPRSSTQNTLEPLLSRSSSIMNNEKSITSRIEDSIEDFFIKKLEKDIVSHVTKLTEDSNKTMDYRVTVFKRLEFVIMNCFPNSNIKTKLFGSCATGLALKTSDVDIAISGFNIMDNSNIISILQLINEKLKYFEWIKVIKPIYSASIPVLKLEINPIIPFNHVSIQNIDYTIQDIIDNHHNIEGLNLNLFNPEELIIRVDLSVENWSFSKPMSHLGYLTTEFVENMLNTFPSLYAMTMIFKQSLQKKNLLNMYQGGISSYCLILMIIAYYKKYGETNYSNDFLNFLKFYGCEFDPTTTGISIIKENEYYIIFFMTSILNILLIQGHFSL